MRTIAVAIGALVIGWAAGAAAQSQYQRCQDQKQRIEDLRRESGEIDARVQDIDRQLAEMSRRMREMQADKAQKQRRQRNLANQIKREETAHARSCRGLQQCARLEEQVAQLKQKLDPQSERLRKIRDAIRDRNREIGELSSDVRRIENQYAQLGCDNLQIGQTAQSTFDRCSQLSKDWDAIQRRIDALQAAVAKLRQGYQKAMDRMRAESTQLARLLKQFREQCSHSTDRLAELESLDRQQHEYRSIKEDLDKMDSEVSRFRQLKLRPSQTKPTLKPKPKRGDTTR